ncbi:MAG: hypothetical protein ACRCWM_03935 [Sarcina sp.]
MKTVNVTVRMPEELHKEFKIKMVIDSTTMQEYLLGLVMKDLGRTAKDYNFEV